MVHKVTSTRMKIDLNGAEGVETQRGIPVLREVLLSVFSSGKKEVLVSVETRQKYFRPLVKACLSWVV